MGTLLVDELRHDALSPSHRCFLCLGPSSGGMSSTFFVAKQMVFQVHCFQFLDDVVVERPSPSAVVLSVCIGIGGSGWPCITTQEERYAIEVLKRRIKSYRSDIIVRLV